MAISKTPTAVSFADTPRVLRRMLTAPTNGQTIRAFIPDEGEPGNALFEAHIMWRNDERGVGWVLAGDPYAFVFEPIGWLPA